MLIDVLRRTRKLARPYRYALAAVLFLLALGLRFFILPVEAGLAFTTFYPAVFLAYFFLGVGPGVMVMLLSALAGHYIFEPPFWSFEVTLNGALISFTFVLSNSLIGWLTLRHTNASASLKQAYAAQKDLQRQLESALADARDLYLKAPFGYYSLNSAGEIIQLNEELLIWLEAEEGDLLGTPIAQYFDAAGQELFRSQFPRFRRDGRIEGLEFRLTGTKGKTRQVSVSASAVYNTDGSLLRTRSVMFDITELKAAKSHLETQRQLLSGIVESLPYGVALFDEQLLLHRYNKRFQEMLGYPDEVLAKEGFSFGDLIRLNVARGDYGDQTWEAVYGKLGSLMRQRIGTHFERQTHDGRWIDITGIAVFEGWTLITYVDITASKHATLNLENAQKTALKAIEDQKVAYAETHFIAFHDALTGLPNRRLFAERTEQAADIAVQANHKLAICYLDLDGFKQVNDTHGHDVGDKLLMTVSKRLTQCVRGHDTVGRLGGDEFVLLLTNLEGDQEINAVLQRILQTIAEPVSIDMHITAHVSASLGYSLFPDDAQDMGLLMRYADTAMYQAKKQGKNCCVRYSAET